MEKDMGGMLGALLSDPSAVAQIAALAKTLGPTLEGSVKPPAQSAEERMPPPPPDRCDCRPVPVVPAGDISAIAKCCALLEALRLFTGGERRGRIDRILAVLKLAKNVV